MKHKRKRGSGYDVASCPWWNREVQITEFVKQWIPVQLHSEADASKDGQIRPHIRWPYPAGYGRIWKFGRISAGAGAGYDIRCNPSLIWVTYSGSACYLRTLTYLQDCRVQTKQKHTQKQSYKMHPLLSETEATLMVQQMTYIHTYTVSQKKRSHFYFFNNSVKC